jgi:hypothetical protein
VGGPAADQAAPGRRYPPPARSEPYWPAPSTVLLAVGLQLLLPDRVTAGPSWLLPAFEGVLLVGLALATPGQPYEIPRRAARGLTALVSVANAISLGLLIHALLHHHGASDGYGLITAGALIWVTNVLMFGLWYWEIDRGGRDKRAAGRDGPPDFLFPQMNDDAFTRSDWRPEFVDYLYVSLTNATAFSPTDALPLTRGAKAIMALQSLVSLLTIGLVITHAVNVLR